MKLVIIDAGHGGKDPGAVATGGKKEFHESVLARGIVRELMGKLQTDGKLSAKTSFEACGKDIEKDSWTAQQRRRALSDYNKNTGKIDYILSIHLNSSATETPSGLVVCHNNLLTDANGMYGAITKAGSDAGLDFAGNREETVQNRPNLSVLNASILGIIEKLGIHSLAAESLKTSFMNAINMFKGPESGSTLFGLAEHLSDQVFANNLVDKGKYLRYLQEMGAATGSFENDAMLFVAASGDRKIERIPALLVEVGFISNAADRQIIIDNPQVYAKGIGEGLYAILADIQPMFA